ncbi:MAG: cell shape determination protein CcmA [Bacteroidetes bacterium GWF2_33_16]|nr:MAG: cell shape determination protein CcmA [Bacteroidetes bacterium GWE2_32_14]OFY04743.1 MAG: cell shape determination protein CcmA [Bacteroidetes bacterium GWF2_33_16]
MAKNNDTETTAAINLIGVGTDIKGDIVSNGDLRIDGSLTGNLNTSGKLVIGETGKINGEITCKNSEVLGEIKGKIKVSELLSLKATAKIFGDIITKKLAIEPGSKFTGNCNMGEESVSSVKPENTFISKDSKSA